MIMAITDGERERMRRLRMQREIAMRASTEQTDSPIVVAAGFLVDTLRELAEAREAVATLEAYHQRVRDAARVLGDDVSTSSEEWSGT